MTYRQEKKPHKPRRITGEKFLHEAEVRNGRTLIRIQAVDYDTLPPKVDIRAWFKNEHGQKCPTREGVNVSWEDAVLMSWCILKEFAPMTLADTENPPFLPKGEMKLLVGG